MQRNQTRTGFEQATSTYVYKVGTLGIILGVVFVLMAFAMTKPLLGGETEWHVFSATDPFVVPSPLLAVFWWMMFGLGAGGIVLSWLPALALVLTDTDIHVPNLLTRKYTAVQWSQIVDVTASKYGFTLSDGQQQVHIAKLAMRGADWERLKADVGRHLGVEEATLTPVAPALPKPRA